MKNVEDMDGMPEHLFENDMVDGEEVKTTFEMINFKHKQQKRDKCDEPAAEEQESKPQGGSYLNKLESLAQQWDGSIEEKLPIFVRFENSSTEAE